jgi:O-methyltransferase domain
VDNWCVGAVVISQPRYSCLDLHLETIGVDDPRVDATSTHRLLRAHSTVGTVLEHTDGRFSLLPMGECLLPDVPGFFEALVRLNGSDWCGSVYLGLAEAVKTGESAFTRRHGEGMFAWLSKHPMEREIFARAMSTFTGIEAEWVLDAYDFTKYEHIVDVGGGKGSLISSILSQTVDSQGTLFDLPEVVATKASSFSPPGIPNPGKIMDIIMMALLDGGRERSTDEHAALMRKIGLRFESTIQTLGNITLFEGSR